MSVCFGFKRDKTTELRLSRGTAATLNLGGSRCVIAGNYKLGWDGTAKSRGKGILNYYSGILWRNKNPLLES